MSTARKPAWALAAAAAAVLAGCGSAADTPTAAPPSSHLPSSSGLAPESSDAPPPRGGQSSTERPTRNPPQHDGSPRSPAQPTEAGGESPDDNRLDRCHTSQLAGEAFDRHAFVSHKYETLGLTNISGSACTMFGYPGISPARQSGQLDATLSFARPAPGHGVAGPYRPPEMVAVDPGSSVYFTITYSVAGMDRPDCDGWDLLAVTPPDETDHLYIDDPGSGCGPAFVEPVRQTPP